LLQQLLSNDAAFIKGPLKMTGVMTRGFWQLAPLLWLSVFCTNTLAEAPSYRQSIIGSSEEPYMQLSNDSPSPIAAYVMVQRPSIAIEGRSYYDEFVSPRDLPIAHGESKRIRLGHLTGSDLNTLRATVNAVVFENGSSAGDATWVNVILARRVRLHERLLSLRALLELEVGKGLSRDELVGQLHALQEAVDQQTLADDLRVVDDTAIDGAILTFSAAQDFSVDPGITNYVNYLSMRILHLEQSLPKLDSLKGIPQIVPAPLAKSADVPGSR
jgi:hypothetical protein